MQHDVAHTALECPTCSTSHLYNLADGRFKCSLCKKTFNASDNRQSRLSPLIHEELAKAFWEMSGTTDTADKLKLNIKTVQKYFGLLRVNLAKHVRLKLIEQLGSDKIPSNGFESFSKRNSCGQNAHPLAAVIKTGDNLNLLIASHDAAQPVLLKTVVLGWLYAQDNEGRQRINLDRIHCQSQDTDSITLAMPFWKFIKQGLIHYQGGFRHHFYQYLREMEFRYNDRQEQLGADICIHFLTNE